MSLYSDYIKEREDKDMIENEYGFCIYKINKDHLYFQDAYILPKYRNKGKCKGFLAELECISKENQIKVIIASFCINANDWFKGKNFLQKNGFKYYMKDKWNKMIYCIKEIS